MRAVASGLVGIVTLVMLRIGQNKVDRASFMRDRLANFVMRNRVDMHLWFRPRCKSASDQKKDKEYAHAA